MTFTRALGTNNYGPAKFIVDGTTVANGTHSTIAAALTSASSGDTIFIRPGTYTENLTLKAGVNLSSFDSESSLNGTGHVIISGTATMTTAGSVSISGIQLQTNSAALLAVTGSAASIVNLHNCYLNCTNNSGITFSSSSASARINLNNCKANLGTTGIALFSHSSAGNLNFEYCMLENSGGSSTVSTASAGELNLWFCYVTLPITTSGTNLFQDRQCHHNLSALNITALTVGGSGINIIRGSTITSGSATAISMGGTVICDGINVSSTNSAAISGAGTISYNSINFGGTSSNVTVTTQQVLNTGPSTSVGSSNSGNTNSLTVTNSSNTASSAAAIIASVGGTSAADPVHQSTVSGTTTWTWGIDNSDSDAWVLAQGTALGTNNVMRVATTGEINYPLQSAFLAVAATQGNVTGDGTTYTVTFTTEIFDQNNDFDGTSTFTAPITGRYQLSVTLTTSGLSAGMTLGTGTMVTSNRNYTGVGASFGACQTSTGTFRTCQTVLADMDAGDTCTCTIQISNSTLTADIAPTATTFSGFLAC